MLGTGLNKMHCLLCCSEDIEHSTISIYWAWWLLWGNVVIATGEKHRVLDWKNTPGQDVWLTSCATCRVIFNWCGLSCHLSVF